MKQFLDPAPDDNLDNLVLFHKMWGKTMLKDERVSEDFVTGCWRNQCLYDKLFEAKNYRNKKHFNFFDEKWNSEL